MVPAFRETAASLWRGLDPRQLLLFNAGYNEGGRLEPGARDLPIAIPVASQLPHAVGIAYATQLRSESDVTMTFFGDGATSEGDFHEALNFAGVFALPVVFVCQNNQYAISTPRRWQTASRTLAQKALAYGVPGRQVDGNDVLAVHVAAREAVARARAGDGPTMLELETYRLEVHTTADDPSRYRSEEEVDTWRRRDPIPRFQTCLVREGVLTVQDIEDLESELAAELDEAWRDVQELIETLDDPAEMFAHLVARPHAALRLQARQLVKSVGRGQGSSGDDGDDGDAEGGSEEDGDAEDGDAESRSDGDARDRGKGTSDDGEGDGGEADADHDA
jgi:TPP-dependent pyruvate/acetoin dehydrogenase alpha subunit